jgi:hypothetical protein
MAPPGQPYRVKDILALCRELQWLEKRHENQGVAELMRMAVTGEPSEETAVVLCRLLFRSRTGDSLRRPWRGQPGFLGETTYSDWPLEPVHLFRGVPFHIVRGWAIAGLPEPAPWYLAYCLRNGAWVAEDYPDRSDQELLAVAHAFVETGPWVDPRDEHERHFILSQVE